ncbi:acyltransferase family protein [Sphingomonas oligophenolica]|uniref:Acyltransferase n=1 Tax=Sphingomonas oligophenolica TaxID=301154 RepID=A0A502CRZ4_9SPHN|nr:acyltransferase [Sphingomonas oligophenolica]TPG15502.1 acyltransferase [Sphingomonas oligophenolica]
MTRHYGMDWLRIGAFALLILYHIGMVFVPWNFHVKADPLVKWALLPMLVVNAWRLSLLFVVSGYASRALLRRAGGVGGFMRNRSFRLLVPLAFGIAVIVPPQPWVELTTKAGYDAGYLHFWLYDYFAFQTVAGVPMPNWNHLWFVGYLWLYTALLAAMIVTVRLPRLQGWFDRAFGGLGVIVIPLAYLVAVHAWWLPMVGETHLVVGDWIAHLSYLPAFLFGFALAGSDRALVAIARWWLLALGLAVLGYLFIMGAELRWWTTAMMTPRTYVRLYGAAHAFEQWGGLVALIGAAERWFNRDRAIRPVLTEAVFPFYVAHQTIIVVVMYWLLPARLPGWANFAILVASTIAGCWAFYMVGRSIGWLRPLIGLRRRIRPLAAPII